MMGTAAASSEVLTKVDLTGGAGSETGAQDQPSPAESEGSYQKRLGQQLRAVRRAHGMRLQDVEDASDGRFKAVVVGSYERGDRAVSAHKLASLAEFYGVTVADLLPDQSRRSGARRDPGVKISVDRLRQLDEEDAAPLMRLVTHVQWLRGDYAGRVLSLRDDDLRTVGVALGLTGEELDAWLAERDLLID